MTGPAEGKLLLEGAVVELLTDHGKIALEEAEVYIHVKGYSLARVTHLDIEHPVLDNIIPPKRGRFLKIIGLKSGLRIQLREGKSINLNGKNITVYAVKVSHPYLTKVLTPRESTVTWVGGKFGGIYIGFRKEQVRRLEEIARNCFKFNI